MDMIVPLNNPNKIYNQFFRFLETLLYPHVLNKLSKFTENTFTSETKIYKYIKNKGHVASREKTMQFSLLWDSLVKTSLHHPLLTCPSAFNFSICGEIAREMRTSWHRRPEKGLKPPIAQRWAPPRFSSRCVIIISQAVLSRWTLCAFVRKF